MTTSASDIFTGIVMRVIVLAVLLALLGACGKKNEDTTSGTTDVAQQGPAVPPPAATSATPDQTAAADATMTDLKSTAMSCRGAFTDDSQLLTYLYSVLYRNHSNSWLGNLGYSDAIQAYYRGFTSSSSGGRGAASLNDNCYGSLSSLLDGVSGYLSSGFYNDYDVRDYLWETAGWVGNRSWLPSYYNSLGYGYLSPLQGGGFGIAAAGAGGFANTGTYNTGTINNTTTTTTNTNVTNNITISGNSGPITVNAGNCTLGASACRGVREYYRKLRAEQRKVREARVTHTLSQYKK